MGRFIFSLLIMVMSMTSWAQNSRGTSLEIILSDHGHLRINVNDREFDEVNKKIYIQDLPSGKNYVEVIKVCNDKSDMNCNKKVFYGYIDFKKNMHYQAVVLVGEQEIIVSDKGNLFTDDFDQKDDISIELLPSEVIMNLKKSLNNEWLTVLNTMSEKETEKEKVAVLNRSLINKSITVEQLTPLLSTLIFDESKSNVITENYSKISNPQSIRLLRNAFTLESNFEEMLFNLKK